QLGRRAHPHCTAGKRCRAVRSPRRSQSVRPVQLLRPARNSCHRKRVPPRLRRTAMEGFVAHKLNEYATGKLTRRALIETLTLAATTAYASNAKAAEQPGIKLALVNHISYNCPNFRQAADWYSKAFNLDQVGATDRDVALPFGKKGEQPYGVTATDVPLTHLIIRTRDLNAPAANGVVRPRPQAVVDHICYT